MADFHFLRPDWLWLLLVPVLFALWQWRRSDHENNPWQRVCEPALLQHLLHPQTGKSRWTLTLLQFMVWSLLVIAISGPTWQRRAQTLYRQQSAGVMVADMSVNMLGKDVKPSRLSREKFKLHDIFKKLNEHALGMIAFAKEPYVVSPITADLATLSALVPELSPGMMPVQGESIHLALDKAVDLLKQAGQRHGFIILVTASKVNVDAINAAKNLGEHGYQLFILSIGSKTGAPVPAYSDFVTARGQTRMSRIDDKAYAELARLGHGAYFPYSADNRDVEQLLRALPSEQGFAQQQQRGNDWLDWGRYLLWCCLPLIALLYRRGWYEEMVS